MAMMSLSHTWGPLPETNTCHELQNCSDSMVHCKSQMVKFTRSVKVSGYCC